ncbi:agamous-like MADS-box protein AGL80 isoform X1 [Raphanus sativus]|uniref:Agamous-like MADS-box protein AGL80 isoform X1 n=1 Tax=Raphanus sativus TaxID=3726 RepID=A0A9W3DUH2_RAPSA|nr:agamous-like MADS-box protein AGL80 isoform X1 [Raphanus sativus]
MTRKKLNISYITNDSMRKSTFNKRKKGFFKKIYELSVLCGIQACAVIYSPFSSTPEVWPSNSEVKKVVEKFEQIPDTEQEKKMVNHEGFLRQSITKTRENITKKIMDNTDMAMNETMFQFLRGRGDMFQLTDKHRDDLCRHIDQYLKELYHHRKILSQSHLEHGESSSAANAMTQPAAIAEEGSSSLPNPDAFNSAKLVDTLLAPTSIISSSQKLELIDTFENNYPPAASDQQAYHQMMNPVNLDLNPNQYQQNFEGCPNSQDGIYNQNHQQEEWLVSQMMNNPNQVRFPMMDDNNHQQP